MADKDSGILLYDYLFVKGGAEKLSLCIFDNIENTDFCVGFKNDELFPSTNSTLGEKRIYALTGYTCKKGWKTIKTLATFLLGKVFDKKYAWAIYSGDYAPLAILRNRKTAKKNILYCHSIPRSIYDLKERKLAEKSFIERMAFRAMCAVLKSLYEPSIRKMDVVVSNSENVRRRIKEYVGLDATVIHPPIDTKRFKWLGQSDYYLSTARLEPEKRVETIVRSFMEMPDKKLVVCSGGSEYGRLVELAKGHENITFLGWSSDEDIFRAVGNCIATIYIPVDEDFGMSPVESMSAGKPVIGAAEGGLLETVIDGKTGILLEHITPESLSDAVRTMSPEYSLSLRSACEHRAEDFCEEKFIDKIREVVRSE